MGGSKMPSVSSLWLALIASGCAVVDLSAVLAQPTNEHAEAKKLSRRSEYDQNLKVSSNTIHNTTKFVLPASSAAKQAECSDCQALQQLVISVSANMAELKALIAAEDPGIESITKAAKQCGDALTERFKFESQQQTTPQFTENSFCIFTVILAAIAFIWIVCSCIQSVTQTRTNGEIEKVKNNSLMLVAESKADQLKEFNKHLWRLVSTQPCCRCSCQGEHCGCCSNGTPAETPSATSSRLPSTPIATASCWTESG